MDDRHKTPRIYASGAQKRKLKVDRYNQREEVISQIPKLTNYFISSRQSANVSKNETNNENVEILTSNENETICENVVVE
jgi:hypothetical protein